jgi:hypothetical protein
MRPRRDSARRVASLIAVGTVAGVTRERRKEDRGDIPNGLSTDDRLTEREVFLTPLNHP